MPNPEILRAPYRAKDDAVQYEVRIQDPTEPPRSPLFDIIVQLVREGTVVRGRMFFGFLTGSGMDALLAVPDVAAVLTSAELDVLVGLDAVTDRAGLERLLTIAATNEGFNPRVIKNTTGILIHPKMLLFEYADGEGALVVGSNNLSSNGLGGNVEAYSLLRYGPREVPDLADWDGFIERWLPLLSPIDDDALERAHRNERRLERIRRAVKTPASPGPSVEVVVSDGLAHETSAVDETLGELMLVAAIPGAGGRWSQVHYSADIVQQYFNASAGDEIVLRPYDGFEVEARRLVYAERNRNYKIELGAAREAARTVGYPATGRPVVVFRRESDVERRHRYVFLMPGDPGQAETARLAQDEFDGPSNQVPRVIVPRSRVLAAWPECPL